MNKDKLKIALIGYGKMGKAIEEIALKQGHEIVLRISSQNVSDFTAENIKTAEKERFQKLLEFLNSPKEPK